MRMNEPPADPAIMILTRSRDDEVREEPFEGVRDPGELKDCEGIAAQNERS
jgi:hypothetical protein